MAMAVMVLVVGVVSFFMAMSVEMVFFVAMDGFVMMLSMEMAVDVFVEILFFVGVAVDVFVKMLFFVAMFVKMILMGVAVDVLVEMLFFVAVFVKMILMGVEVTKAAAPEMVDQKPCAEPHDQETGHRAEPRENLLRQNVLGGKERY